MSRWCIYIDVEGFAETYDKGPQALRSLGALMEGIYQIGTRCFGEHPNRMFAHQIGDGFIIVGEFGDQTLETPLAIAIALLRVVLSVGGAAKAAVSEGDFGDVVGCYPECILENLENPSECPVIRLGGGVMTIFPVMGTALANSYRTLKKAPSGALLVIEKDLCRRTPEGLCFRDVGRADICAGDWLHASFPALSRIIASAQLGLPDTPTMESGMCCYLEANPLPEQWKANTLQTLGL